MCLAMIAARAIQKGYDDMEINFNNRGWSVETLSSDDNFISIKISKDNNVTYMLCHEGTQNFDQIKTDIEAMNNNKRKKVNGKKGQILKEIWVEYNKYKTTYTDFYNTYNSEGTVMFAGHSLGGAVAGVAAAMFNVKSILLAPIPFIVHKNWLKNYTHNPKSYVDKDDPCVGDAGKIFQINWSITRHYSVNYINNGGVNNCHYVSQFVNYFRNRTNNLC